MFKLFENKGIFNNDYLKTLTKRKTVIIITYVITVFLLSLFSTINFKKGYNLSIGQIAQENIVAPKSFTIIDKESTEKLKNTIIQNTKNVYSKKKIELDTTNLDYFINTITYANKNKIINLITLFFDEINKNGYAENLFKPKDYRLGIILVNKESNNLDLEINLNSQRFNEFKKKIIITKTELKKNIIDTIKKHNLNNQDVKKLTNFLLSNIISNIQLNKKRSIKLLQKELSSAQDVIIKIKKNDIIINKGEIITEQKKNICKTINKIKIHINFNKFLIILLIYIILFLFFHYYITIFIPEFFFYEKNLIILATLLLLSTIIMKLYLIIMSSYYIYVHDLVFLISTEISVILSVIVLYRRITLIVTILNSIIISIIYIETFNNIEGIISFTLLLGITTFFSSMFGAYSLIKSSRRINILKSGIVMSIANIILLYVFSFFIKQTNVKTIEISYVSYISIFIKGLILTPILTIGIIPFFESIFLLCTDYKLLELSDLSNPLLRELATKALGTYQHSLVVANLCENAAEAIGANSLLARVGAYYHDIGKTFSPRYFIENQQYFNAENPHNNIKPSLSNSVLKAHVKRGIELGEKWKLPKPILDMIEQHHAKSLMTFFYTASLRAKEDIPEEEYRYPGPNPQFKEVAILSLADTLEAMSRTLKNPTSIRIKESVEFIIRKKMLAGDLDEANLTLKEIKTISQTFIKILTTMYHSRIEYPDEQEIQKLEKEKKEMKK